ncbi:uncharacterized protein LOC106169492 [Lingula anatina]|uniref:Uncharacterized protein LOC106169492 n=1 Tax=Lingula anatina TaxID=7574 RepID=A0A1S3J3G7_LINAN|nr:uncharacterized protein LOC106169492 [Lingula anatina]|eukprot:XP_013404409.1 uncharacterized protein LOC106169492 [Lingula anatina]
MCSEYLLSLVARQGQLWTEDDHADKLLDSLMLNVLLEQFFGVSGERQRTLDNLPLRKLHEKIVTDVALDVLLTQLSQALDEDMADLDEYERGLDMTSALKPSR